VKTLVEGYPDDEEDEEHHQVAGSDRDVELNQSGLDEGSDDDEDSDTRSLDALEEKWNELEVSGALIPHAKILISALLGNCSHTGCRCARPRSLYQAQLHWLHEDCQGMVTRHPVTADETNDSVRNMT
jgi:hypothetical protein